MTDVFKQDFFEVQDANSQLVAALDVKPGMRVVDTCAGAGGKHCIWQL
jgi:16S rRNA (cytosine967-C5)-methyltransferase